MGADSRLGSSIREDSRLGSSNRLETQAGVDVTDSGQNFFSGKPRFLPLRLSIDWMMPTHTIKGNLYLKAADYRC